MILKEDADFRYKCFSLFILGGGNLYARHQIFFSVRAKYPDRKLGTCQDNRLVQSFQHKTECGSSVCHRVRAMQDDKALIAVVVLMDNMNQLPPHIRFHVRRVHRRVELIRINREIEFLQFGDMLLELFEIEILQCACHGVLNHSNCSTGVY